MKVFLFYTLGSPDTRKLEELGERLSRERLEVELVEADSPDGVRLAKLYDILERPAVVLANFDGSPVERWQGAASLPQPGDVVYHAHKI